jgi:hypothetical protein
VATGTGKDSTFLNISSRIFVRIEIS